MTNQETSPRHGSWLSPYLTVADIARAVDFYQDAFGFEKLVVLDDPQGKPVHAEMRHRGSIVMLGTHPDQTTGSKPPNDLGGTSVRLYVYMNDVDATIEAARKRGAIV